MKKEAFQRIVLLVTGVAVLSLGFLVIEKNRKITALTLQVGELRISLEQYQAQTELAHAPGRWSNRGHAGSEDAGAPDEEEELLAVLERKMRGDFILEYEDPRQRRRAEQFKAQAVELHASRVAPEYSRIFGELGISQEVIPQLQQHISQIYKATVEAEFSMQQLLSAKNLYKVRLKENILSPEQYSAYIAYEESKKGAREISALETFARERNLALDPKSEQAITELLQRTQAYTEKRWDGPLDGLPEIVVGNEAAADYLNREIAQISENAVALLAMAQENNLPQDYIVLLKDYYDQIVASKRTTIENVLGPPVNVPPRFRQPRQN
jgi:hypothetical protein